MRRPRDGRADRPLRHRKARDRAAILPLIGAILFLPPVAAIVRMDVTVAGIPLLAIYVFAVWAGLILGAALLAPVLRDSESSVDEAGADGGGAAAGSPVTGGPSGGLP